jgi:hypothetical protein
MFRGRFFVKRLIDFDGLKDILMMVVIVIVSLLVFSPVFRGMTTRLSTNNDFLQLATRHHIFRENIIHHKEFPLRTPYLGGGFPTITDPEDPSLSPFVILTLLFGEIAGMKLIAAVVFLAGGIGMYLLTRRIYQCSPTSSLFASMVLTLSGWYPMRMGSGNINELYYFLVPLVLLLFEKFVRGGNHYLLWLSLLLAGIAMDGKLVFPSILLFLVCYSIILSIKVDNGHIVFESSYIKKCGVVIGCAVMLSMVKILPVLELFSLKGSIFNPVIDTHQPAYNDVSSIGFSRFLAGMVLWDTHDRPRELFVGILPIILSVLALVVSFKSNVRWFILFLFFALLWLGPSAPIDIFYILWHMPLFGSMTQPLKYFSFFIVFIISIMAASGCRAIEERMSGIAAKEVIIFFGLFIASTSLYFFSYGKYMNMFDTQLSRVIPKTHFFQVKYRGQLELDRFMDNSMYWNVLNNIGTIDWYGAIILDENAIPRFFVDRSADNNKLTVTPNPGYRGEIFYKNNNTANTAAFTRFSANKIGIHASVAERDVLIINQNYDTHWKSNVGVITPEKGLLSIKFDEPGAHDIELRYTLKTVVWGFILSALTMLLLIGYTIIPVSRVIFLRHRACGMAA